MWKFILVFIIAIHGLIHLLGFVKSFDLAPVKKLTGNISKTNGVFWLSTSILSLITAYLIILHSDFWSYLGICTAVLSQCLIFTAWKDAGFGTWANILILITSVFTLGVVTFENGFKRDYSALIERTHQNDQELITEKDLNGLPSSVKRYLMYTGAVNNPKVSNMKVIFEGKFRTRGKDWFSFTSEQYNAFDEPERLFFMKANMFGVTVPGYHNYKNGKAAMDIRLFGLYPLVFKSGAAMDTTETVTLFNDMCLLAPATLIDQRIKWEIIDSLAVKATFTTHGISVSANLYFNANGQLVNFKSYDRTEINAMTKYPFSTPVHRYKVLNEKNVMAEGDAVWQYPDGKFVYGKFTLIDILYNVKK
jgi:hypothetical protein